MGSLNAGTYGAAITLACDGKELEQLADIEKNCNTRIAKLPGIYTVIDCIYL